MGCVGVRWVCKQHWKMIRVLHERTSIWHLGQHLRYLRVSAMAELEVVL
jgi:hypothetical protein